jgi:hypothetical protein
MVSLSSVGWFGLSVDRTDGLDKRKVGSYAPIDLGVDTAQAFLASKADDGAAGRVRHAVAVNLKVAFGGALDPVRAAFDHNVGKLGHVRFSRFVRLWRYL